MQHLLRQLHKEKPACFLKQAGIFRKYQESTQGDKGVMIICLLWTVLLAVWMPVYFTRLQKELYTERKSMLIATWCISLLVSVFIGFSETNSARAVALSALAFLLAAIAVIDYENRIIPNHLQLHLVAAGIFEYIILFLTEKEDFPYKLVGNCLMGFGVFAILFLIALLSKGLGGGDIKLLGLIGCMCGYTITVSILFWALVSSASVSIVLLLKKKKGKKDTMPFAPFIWIGYLISVAALYKDVWRMQ